MQIGRSKIIATEIPALRPGFLLPSKTQFPHPWNNMLYSMSNVLCKPVSCHHKYQMDLGSNSSYGYFTELQISLLKRRTNTCLIGLMEHSMT